MRLAPPPGRMIDIGTHRLHLSCAGEGTGVVFDAALGASSLSWTFVQQRAARFARACTYDRAGFGWSDAGPLPRTVGRITDELRALLEAGGVAPPLVLVGHSFGALTARLFARRYPEDVSGLVLLDPADPAIWRRPSDRRQALIARGTVLCRYGARAARLRIADLVSVLASLGALRLARACSRLVSRGQLQPSDELVLSPVGRLPPDLQRIARRAWTQPKFFEALGSQIASMSASAAEVDDEQDFGDLPVVVVSSERSPAEEISGHAALAARSRRGRHMIAADSGHWIPLDRPDVAEEAIRAVLTP